MCSSSRTRPRAYDNSIYHGFYHGFYRGGKLHDSHAKVIGSPASAPSPTAFTEVFRGAADRVAWSVNLLPMFPVRTIEGKHGHRIYNYDQFVIGGCF